MLPVSVFVGDMCEDCNMKTNEGNTMIDRTVFVYVKDQQVKARYNEDAIYLEDDPEWEHIGTLEPRAYIQNILEEYPSLVSRMRGISAPEETL
jgi:hypothetical protein